MLQNSLSVGGGSSNVSSASSLGVAGSAETTPNSSSSRAGAPAPSSVSSDQSRGGSSRRKPAERPHRHHPTHHSGAVKSELIDSSYSQCSTGLIGSVNQGLIANNLNLGVDGKKKNNKKYQKSMQKI